MLFTSSENSAVGPLDHFGQKFPFRHFGGMEFRVAAHVFDADRHFEKILRFANVGGGRFTGCRKSVGHREQDHACSGHPHSPSRDDRSATGVLVRFTSRLNFFKCSRVKPVGRAEIHGHAVLHDAILLENLVEHFERTAAVDHEIFRDDLKPVDDRFFLQDVPVMRHAQADANAVFGEIVKWICRQ